MINKHERKLAGLALSLERWADLWPRNARVRAPLGNPPAEMRLEANRIREQLGERKWREFVMEGFC